MLAAEPLCHTQWGGGVKAMACLTLLGPMRFKPRTISRVRRLCVIALTAVTIAVIVSWPIQYWRGVRVTLYLSSWYVTFDVSGGAWVVDVHRYPSVIFAFFPGRIEAGIGISDRWELFPTWRDRVFQRGNGTLVFLDFMFSRQVSPGGHANCYVLVPMWFTAAALIAITLLARRWARRMDQRKPSASHCAACGYDLRASSGQCPECGEPIRV